jgi:hypothetical protein
MNRIDEKSTYMVGGERTTCASTASSLNLCRANARRPLTHSTYHESHANVWGTAIRQLHVPIVTAHWLDVCIVARGCHKGSISTWYGTVGVDSGQVLVVIGTEGTSTPILQQETLLHLDTVTDGHAHSIRSDVPNLWT